MKQAVALRAARRETPSGVVDRNDCRFEPRRRAAQGKACAAPFLAPVTRNWSSPRATRCAILARRTRAASRSWCRSATAACSPRPSPSSAAPRRSWPPTSPQTPTTGLTAQLCGDAHLSNFGVFSAPDRRLVFDCNDFDETCPGPFEWDVKRLAASVAVAGRRARLRRAASARRRAGAPRPPTGGRCASFAAMRNLDVWYSRLDVERGSTSSAPQVDGKRVSPARTRPRQGPAPRTACGRSEADPRRRRRAADRQRPAADHAAGGADRRRRRRRAAAGGARRLPRVAGRRTAGTWPPPTATSTRRGRSSGSAASAPAPGSCCCSGEDAGDPLFLQAKEARPRCWSPTSARAAYRNHGRRVVEGQRLMQAASDVFLGWVDVEGMDGQER